MMNVSVKKNLPKKVLSALPYAADEETPRSDFFDAYMPMESEHESATAMPTWPTRCARTWSWWTPG